MATDKMRAKRAAKHRRATAADKIAEREADRAIRMEGQLDTDELMEIDAILGDSLNDDDDVVGREPDRELFDEIARMSGNDTVGRMT